MALFESESIRRESFDYAIELAKRTDAMLTLMVILPFDASLNPSSGIAAMIDRALQAQTSLKNLVTATRSTGIIADIVVRLGNPRSELIKYLAEAGRPEIIVWGSAPDLMKRKDHWLVRMKDILAFPVITPFIKTDAAIGYA